MGFADNRVWRFRSLGFLHHGHRHSSGQSDPQLAALRLRQRTDPGGSFVTLAPGNTQIDNWTVGPAVGVDYIGGYWQAQNGSRSIDLSGTTLPDGGPGPYFGSISQDFTATIGQQYKVTFWLSGNPDGPPDPKKADVTVDGLAPISFLYPITGDKTDMNWVEKSFFFTATAVAQTITFASDATANNTNYGPAIDDVDISPVPTPPAFLLFATGLGLLTWFGWRANRKSEVALLRA